jgi:hypothetical protein
MLESGTAKHGTRGSTINQKIEDWAMNLLNNSDPDEIGA